MVDIIIKVSLGEAIEIYDWNKLCKIKRWNPHVFVGVANSNETTELNIGEARFIGINVSELVKEKSKTTICPHCISEIDDEDMVCRNCHKKLR